MFPSMRGQEQPCQEGWPGAGKALAGLAGFRRGFCGCLWRCPDALFEVAEAVLTAPGPVVSLPYLSLEPGFRRGHGMIYQALAGGRIDEEALRDLLVAGQAAGLAAGVRDRREHVPAAGGGDQPGPGVAPSFLSRAPRQARRAPR